MATASLAPRTYHTGIVVGLLLLELADKAHRLFILKVHVLDFLGCLIIVRLEFFLFFTDVIFKIFIPNVFLLLFEAQFLARLDQEQVGGFHGQQLTFEF